MKLIVTVQEGQQFPPWYYGFAYDNWYTLESVFMPMPLNFIVRWFKWIEFGWGVWRVKADSTTRRLRRMVNVRANILYAKGYKDCLECGLQIIKRLGAEDGKQTAETEESNQKA